MHMRNKLVGSQIVLPFLTRRRVEFIGLSERCYAEMWRERNRREGIKVKQSQFVCDQTIRKDYYQHLHSMYFSLYVKTISSRNLNYFKVENGFCYFIPTPIEWKIETDFHNFWFFRALVLKVLVNTWDQNKRHSRQDKTAYLWAGHLAKA